jgi:hypothetical protein
MTMLEIFCSTYTTEPTIPAVIWFLIISHPQIANTTMIFPKLDATIHTVIAARRWIRKKMIPGSKKGKR